MSTFVAECYWPAISEGDVRAALSRIARTADLAPSDVEVRSLGCILVPADGMAFFLFLSPSASLVREVSERAELPFDRVVETLQITTDLQ